MTDENDKPDLSQSQLAKGEGAASETGESYDNDTDRGQIINYAKDPNGMWGSWDTLSILDEENRLNHMRLEALKYSWQKGREFYNHYFGKVLIAREDGTIEERKTELKESDMEKFIDRFELKDYRTRTAIKGKARDQLGHALGVPQTEERRGFLKRLRRK